MGKLKEWVIQQEEDGPVPMFELTPPPAPKPQLVWDKAHIQTLLQNSDKAVVRALEVLYAKQTATEQATDQTQEHNGVGFSGRDAELLSSFAKFYKRAGFLTEKQMGIARQRLMKYWRQLLKDAEANGRPVSYKVPR